MAGKPDLSILELFAHFHWTCRDVKPCGGMGFWGDYRRVNDTQAEEFYKSMLGGKTHALKVAKAAEKVTTNTWFATWDLVHDEAFMKAVRDAIGNPDWCPTPGQGSKVGRKVV